MPNLTKIDQPLIDLVLQRRGWDQKHLDFLQAKPREPLRACQDLTQKLFEAKNKNLNVTVCPDFDTDGVTSGVIAWAGLSQLGFNVNLYIPDPDLGHDVTRVDIQRLLDAYPNTDIILTTDCGSSSDDGINYAHEHGVKVYVTDHHMIQDSGSQADIIVNPMHPDDGSVYKGICGAEVVYRVLQNYADTYDPNNSSAIRLLVLLAGLGTVADVMPLIGPNRITVSESVGLARMLVTNTEKNSYGTLKRLETTKSTTLINIVDSMNLSTNLKNAIDGFATLINVFQSCNKVRSQAEISATFYGFYIAPALNAPRRIGVPMNQAFELFTSGDSETKMAAAKAIIDCNEKRKKLTTDVAKNLQNSEQPLAPYIWFADTRPTMCGPTASSLCEEYGVPTVVLLSHPDGSFSGSCRTPVWYPMIDIMRPRGFFVAGHQNACGARFNNSDELGAFFNYLKNDTEEIISRAETSGQDLNPTCDITLGNDDDCDIDLTDTEALTQLTHDMCAFEPFGAHFPEPTVEVRILTDECAISTLSEGKHLSIETPTGIRLLWWNAGNQCERVQSLTELRFITTPSLNSFDGRTDVQLIIKREIKTPSGSQPPNIVSYEMSREELPRP